MVRRRFFNKFGFSRQNRAKKEALLKEYQRAVAVVLVDIASIDNDFGYEEHVFIKEILSERFSLSGDDVYSLLDDAQAIVQKGEDLDNYGSTLRTLISSEEREEIMTLLDTLLMVDSEKYPYEVKLRQRYEKLLGVRVQPN